MRKVDEMKGTVATLNKRVALLEGNMIRVLKSLNMRREKSIPDLTPPEPLPGMGGKGTVRTRRARVNTRRKYVNEVNDSDSDDDDLQPQSIRGF